MKTSLLALAMAIVLTGLPGQPALSSLPNLPVLGANQVTFEQATADLKNPDANVRFRAVELLKDAAYPEAAIPLASVITDRDNNIQLEAIAAELNIFLAEKVISRKRVGLVIEIRKKIAAEAAFSAGSSVLGPHLVPVDVLTALRRAAHDETPRVALEALYGFGTLAVQPGGPGDSSRRDLLRASGPDLAGMLGVRDPAQHLAALRVIGRVYAKRPQDETVDAVLGDAVIGALNDKDAEIRSAAMQALGAMHYERSVQALTTLLRYYGRGPLAEAALDALAHIARPESTALFKAQLASNDAALKRCAVEGLARSGDRAETSDIQAAISRERNDGVLLAAGFSSAVLASGSIDPIVEELVRTKLHEQAFSYLVELAPGRTTLFTRAAQDPDAGLRAEIADVLGLSGDGAALAIAVPMMQDHDPRVARAAERAVARLRAVP